MSLPIKPKRLQVDSKIGIVNPAYWLADMKLQCAVKVFEDRGYELVLGKSTQYREERFAGTPQQRADDLMSMFTDESIDAIICCRGGYGGNRVLPLLDYGVIKANPKIFVGYSDITGFPCGHGAYQATLPVSHKVELYAKEIEPYILIPESPVVC